MTAAVRKVLDEKPEEFDPPRKYLGPARDALKHYMHKIVNVLGSNGKA